MTENYGALEDEKAGIVAGEGGAKEDLPPMNLCWHNLTCEVKDRKSGDQKLILDNVSGSVNSGECLAVMGPSGGGKTTFLDIITGTYGSGNVTGDVLVNGKPRDDSFRFISGYCPADDTFLEVFSTDETLMFNANLAYGHRLSGKQKRELVDQTLKDTGMVGCAKTRVGGQYMRGLSTGQRRRLSIALLLIVKRRILILDEPLSGLDSAAAFHIAIQIKEIAASGRIVIMSLHQPMSKIWEAMDLLLLISKGKEIYFGKATESMDYFSSMGHACPKYVNPPDFYITLVNKDFEDGSADVDLDKMVETFRGSKQFKAIEEEIESQRKSYQESDPSKEDKVEENRVGFFAQLYYHTVRSFWMQMLSPAQFWARLFVFCFLCTCLGVLYGYPDDITDENVRNLILYTNLVFVFMSIVCVPFVKSQEPTFVRERLRGLTDPIPFALAVLIADTIAVGIVGMASSSILVVLADLRNHIIFTTTFTLALVFGDAVILFAGCLIEHQIIAMGLALMALGNFAQFGGNLTPRKLIPDQFLLFHYTSPDTYIFRILLDSQFRHHNETMLHMYSATDVVLEQDYGFLCALIVFFQLHYIGAMVVMKTGQK